MRCIYQEQGPVNLALSLAFVKPKEQIQDSPGCRERKGSWQICLGLKPHPLSHLHPAPWLPLSPWSSTTQRCALLQKNGQPAPLVVISRAQWVDRVNHDQDTELMQCDILTFGAKLDCHLNYYPGFMQPFDWQEALSAKWMLEGYLDFILTRELRLYLN